MGARSQLALVLIVALGGCHLLFPFDPAEAPPPLDGARPVDARADRAPPPQDAPLPPDAEPPADATTAQDLPCWQLPELCNGFDDNCNTIVDENLTQVCFTGSLGCTKGSDGAYSCVGLCQVGVRTCSNGSWSPCNGQVLPQQELCNNKDDDCDGLLDDGAVCPAMQVCTNGVCK